MIRRLKTAKPEVERAEDDAKIRATVGRRKVGYGQAAE
jgi:hypothetical protein